MIQSTIMRLLPVLLIALFACKTPEDKQTLEMPSDKFDSLQVLKLADADPREQRRQMRLDSLGGVDEIKVRKGNKCNLTLGYYVLKASAIDTADLAFMTRDLARQLSETIKKDEGCDY